MSWQSFCWKSLGKVGHDTTVLGWVLTHGPLSVDHARQLTKNLMRKPTADRLVKQRDADIQYFLQYISRDSIQKSLRVYLDKLRQKKG